MHSSPCDYITFTYLLLGLGTIGTLLIKKLLFLKNISSIRSDQFKYILLYMTEAAIPVFILSFKYFKC